MGRILRENSKISDSRTLEIQWIPPKKKLKKDKKLKVPVLVKLMGEGKQNKHKQYLT